MNRMLTFDSFTLIPTYSDVESRNDVDVSTEICGVKSDIPIINANMLSICSDNMIAALNKNNIFSSYHRFFTSPENRNETILSLKEFKDKMFVSIGIKKEEYDYVFKLYKAGFKNVLIDVNHGHHKMVKYMIKHIKDNCPNMLVMAGNVSSVDGILFLQDAGADVIKIGNSFGFSCSTLKATSFGCHPIHVAKTFREMYPFNGSKLCLDGGIRGVGDIAKSLIFGDMVMLGKMFAGCDESFGKTIITGELKKMKEYYGNASKKTKEVIDGGNHVRYIEGTTKLVSCIGPIQNTLQSIKDGLKSAYSFVGARTIKEYQEKAKHQILMT